MSTVMPSLLTSYGERLRNTRAIFQITQQDVATLFNVTQKEVDLFEQGLPVNLGVRIKLIKFIFYVKAGMR